MDYLVIYSSEFHELKVRKFDSFDEAAELAEDYFEKGYLLSKYHSAQYQHKDEIQAHKRIGVT